MRYDKATKQQLIQIALNEPCGTDIKYKACKELQRRLYAPSSLEDMEEYTMNWGDKRIEQGIWEAMDKLEITRMPTRTELKELKGGQSLTKEISLTKSFKGWAEYLGIDTNYSRRQKNEYAFYQGDKFLFFDTIKNGAKRLGVTYNAAKYWTTKQHEKRVSDDGMHLVFVGAEGDYREDYIYWDKGDGDVKVSELEKERVNAHMVEQLRQLGCNDIDGLSYEEARRKLQAERAKNVVVKSPHASWF